MFRIDRKAVEFTRDNAMQIANYIPPRSLEEADIAAEPPVQEAPPPPPPPPQPTIDLEAVRREAALIVDRAREQARIVEEQAKAEAQSVLQSAHEDGYAKGLRDGAEDIKRQLLAEREREAEAFLHAVEDLSKAADHIFADMEKEILALALAVGEKIVGEAIRVDDGLFPRMVTSALRAIKAEGRMVVRVGADDYARYFPTGRITFKVGEDAVPIQVSEDTSLTPGSIMVETPKETIDASVKTQIMLIREAFAKESGS